MSAKKQQYLEAFQKPLITNDGWREVSFIQRYCYWILWMTGLSAVYKSQEGIMIHIVLMSKKML